MKGMGNMVIAPEVVERRRVVFTNFQRPLSALPGLLSR
jgi:hypothetical protein